MPLGKCESRLMYDLSLKLQVLKDFEGSSNCPAMTIQEICLKRNLRHPTVSNWVKEPEKIYAERDKRDKIYGTHNAAKIKDNKLHKLKGPQTVLVIPDLHAPFEHQDSLAFIKAVYDDRKCTTTVCLGDEADFCAFSKYPKDPDGLSPGQELQRAREHLIPFYLAFPQMRVCTSNHTVRPFKQAFLAGLPEAFIPSYEKLLNAPDSWKWADHWEIDGVRYIHGEGRGGFNAHLSFLRAYKQSVVHGHIHSYAAVSHEGHLFAVNSGCLIDAKAYAFRYAKGMPISVNLGCSVVYQGRRAEFIPMGLNREGRWDGQV